MPPTSLRVVERGRRLEVIDTRRAAPGTAPTPAAAAGATGGLLGRRIRFDGTRRVTTRAFYDTQAPRLLTITPGDRLAAAQLGLAAAAAWALAALSNESAQATSGPLGAASTDGSAGARLRAWSTRLVDRIAARN